MKVVGGPEFASCRETSTERCVGATPRHPRSDVPEVGEPAATKVSLYKEILYTEAEVDARIACDGGGHHSELQRNRHAFCRLVEWRPALHRQAHASHPAS